MKQVEVKSFLLFPRLKHFLLDRLDAIFGRDSVSPAIVRSGLYAVLLGRQIFQHLREQIDVH